jgi:hypothetical protein
MHRFRHYLPAFAAVAFVAPSGHRMVGCDEAESSAGEAYAYAKSALAEGNLGKAQALMVQARDAADAAESQAGDCDCGDAEGDADDASSDARRGSEASTLAELHSLALRTMNAAKGAQAEAATCD